MNKKSEGLISTSTCDKLYTVLCTLLLHEIEQVFYHNLQQSKTQCIHFTSVEMYTVAGKKDLGRAGIPPVLRVAE
jgi:hypothetical protein